MRSHWKASTAGSTQRQAGRLGRFLGGSLAIRGVSLDTNGSSAPAIGFLAFPVALAAMLLWLAISATSALAVAPAIPTITVSSVTAKAAVLEADVNPEGEATSYHFEYGLADCASNPCTSVPVPNAGIGSGTTAVRVQREVNGLTPGTTYHFRVVAGNGTGTTEGPDHTLTTYELQEASSCSNATFRAGPALNLADCRAYEMVSPLDKNGGEIMTGSGPFVGRTGFVQASLDGEKITYTSYTAFGDQQSGRYSNQYLATRGPNGWSTEGINAPQGKTIFDPIFSPFMELQPYYTLFTDDLSYGWLKDFGTVPLTPDGQPDHINLYRRDNSDGSLQALTVNESLGPTNSVFGNVPFEPAENQGASADGSHSFFAAKAKFTPDASDAENKQLYEFFNGEIRLVSILPNGETSSAEKHTVGTENSINPDWRNSSRMHAVSDDGSRVFWTASGSSGIGPLYVRIDGEMTVPVSSGNAQFWTASPDGSKAVYSEGDIFASSSGGDLYTFDIDSETNTQVAGESRGAAGTSEDLSYIYFTSREVLDEGATAGEHNLYVYHGGAKTFIATLARPDANATNSSMSNVNREPWLQAGRVTPDGEHFAFVSTRSLTGYDNTDVVSGKEDMEVYLYDADTEELTCASCNPSGARPRGAPLHEPFTLRKNFFLDLEKRWTAAWLPTHESNQHASRTLSDDGNRLFFNAHDALVPQDTNGVQDVYEWRRQGISGCDKPDGCVSLISTGESPHFSEFVEASADGRDVFFETQSSIHPEDTGLIDIYNARSGGGFPYTPRSISCVGDACQNVPPAPNDVTPASASFKGAGDPKPRKARTRCRARNRKAAKGSKAAKRKVTKRCSRVKRGAGR